MSNHPPTKIQAPIDPATGLPGVAFTRTYYQTGTTTKKDTYYNSDYAVGHKNANPTVSDANGYYPETYLLTDGAYTVVEKDADGNTLSTIDGIWGNKLESAGTPLSGASSNSTAAVTGTNTSSGSGVKGITTGGTGHAGWFEADVSSPVSSAVHIVPQDTFASVPTKGDVQINSVTGGLCTHDGTVERKVVQQIHAILAAEARAISAAARADFKTSKFTVPANTLRVGQTIKIRECVRPTAVTDGVGYMSFCHTFGSTMWPIGGATLHFTGNMLDTDRYVIETVVTILTVGAAGTFSIFLVVNTNSANVSAPTVVGGFSGSWNTTIANDLYLSIFSAAAPSDVAATLQLESMSIDISS